jgi:hypothetical protein
MSIQSATEAIGGVFRGAMSLYGIVLGAGILFIAGGYVAVWIAPESTWAYDLRYGFDDDLKYASVSVDRKPHDCDFWSAPLGSKHCHYEKQVLTTRVRRDQSGVRSVSYDEGKTWAPAAVGIEPVVFVTWERIED